MLKGLKNRNYHYRTLFFKIFNWFFIQQISQCVISICELHNDVKELVSTRFDQLSVNYEGFKQKRKIKELLNTVDVCLKVLSGIKYENDQEKLEEADEVLNAMKVSQRR